VRAACREAFAERVPMLAELADSGTPDVRLRALDMLGRYGLGTAFTLEASDSPTGVIILPELEMRELQESVQTVQNLLPEYTEEVEYIVEDLTVSAPLPEETIDPEIVRKVLEARSKRASDTF
jgi:hypothetical protein